MDTGLASVQRGGIGDLDPWCTPKPTLPLQIPNLVSVQETLNYERTSDTVFCSSFKKWVVYLWLSEWILLWFWTDGVILPLI